MIQTCNYRGAAPFCAGTELLLQENNIITPVSRRPGYARARPLCGEPRMRARDTRFFVSRLNGPSRCCECTANILIFCARASCYPCVNLSARRCRRDPRMLISRVILTSRLRVSFYFLSGKYARVYKNHALLSEKDETF